MVRRGFVSAQLCPVSTESPQLSLYSGAFVISTETSTIRIGTRGSALARAQAQLVADRLSAVGCQVEISTIASDGDRDKTTPLSVIGGRGVFASSLQQALLEGRIDLAVHSAKDLPTERPTGLVIAAWLAREDARDVLVSRHNLKLAELPPHPRIATSSPRRAVQVRSIRSDAVLSEIRGNIDTRIRQALETDLDGIILAAAGLIRLELEHVVSEYLQIDRFVPAPGQAALAVEARASDTEVLGHVARIDDPSTRASVETERAYLAALGAGCTIPVGAFAYPPEHGSIRLLSMTTDQSIGNARFRDDHLPIQSAVEDAAAIAREFVKPAINLSFPVEREASLNGKSILVTRDADELDPLAVAIRDLGGIPVIVPATTTEPLVASDENRRIIESLGCGEFDLVAFTSPRAVHHFSSQQPTIKWPMTTWVGAIGDGTALALEASGIVVNLRPNDATGSALAEAIDQQLSAGARVLHIGPLSPRPELKAGLLATGHQYHLLALYRTIVATEPHQLIQQHIARNEFDAVVVLAPSALHGFVAQSGDQWEHARHLPVVCIGQTTANTARELGMTSVTIAGEPNPFSVASALIRAVQTSRVTV